MRLSVIRRAALVAGALALAAAIFPSPVAAQQVGAQQLRTYVGVLGINPLGIPFDIFSFEGEGVVAPGITMAGALSHFAPDEDRYTSGDVKFRYYPGEVALDGFSVGLGVGVTRFSGLDYSQPCTPTPEGCDAPRGEIRGPTVSIIADYNFLLGPRRRFFVGTGVGAKRFIVDRDERERVGAERAWVFAKFLVGLAF